MTLTSTGSLGIATTTPWRTLSVTGTVGFDGLTSVSSNQSSYICLSSNNEIVKDSTTCLASSARFKQDIQPLTASSSLAEIMQLTPVSFQYTPAYNGALQSDPNFSGTFVGFIAEDVAKIDPRLITIDATGPTPTAPHGVRYENITAILAGAIQALVTELTALEQTVAGFAQSFTTHKVTTDQLCLSDANGTTCYTRSQLNTLLPGQTAAPQSGQGSASTTPAAGAGPTITLLGDNPVRINVGATYIDPDVMVIGPADSAHPYQTFVNGMASDISSTTISTAVPTTYTLTYKATDASGHAATATRTVIVGNPTTTITATSTPPASEQGSATTTPPDTSPQATTTPPNQPRAAKPPPRGATLNRPVSVTSSPSSIRDLLRRAWPLAPSPVHRPSAYRCPRRVILTPCPTSSNSKNRSIVVRSPQPRSAPGSQASSSRPDSPQTSVVRSTYSSASRCSRSLSRGMCGCPPGRP